MRPLRPPPLLADTEGVDVLCTPQKGETCNRRLVGGGFIDMIRYDTKLYERPIFM